MSGSGTLDGQCVAVFGATGFIGRHLVQRLARAGARVRAIARDAEAGKFLKPMGDPGQIAVIPGTVLDDKSVATAIDGADAVVNLVGILYESGAQSFAAVHAEGARSVAEKARAAGARRLVHVSAIGASQSAPSSYSRTKALGEVSVAKHFEGATIMRPSVVFGPGDQFFNRFATLAQFSPVLPLIGGDMFDERLTGGLLFRGRRFGGGTARFQPVYVGDVAEAILRALVDDSTAGKTFELGGPQVYSLRDIMEIVLRETGRRRLLLPLPLWWAAIDAWFLEFLPSPPLTRDQVRLLARDNVVAPNAQGLADLGITPVAVETIVPTYLARYRRAGAVSLAGSTQ